MADWIGTERVFSASATVCGQFGTGAESAEHLQRSLRAWKCMRKNVQSVCGEEQDIDSRKHRCFVSSGS